MLNGSAQCWDTRLEGVGELHKNMVVKTVKRPFASEDVEHDRSGMNGSPQIEKIR